MSEQATETQAKETQTQEKMLPQSEVQKIIDSKYSEWKSKTADYDDLKKFKAEHEQRIQESEQKKLEEQRQYEELKKGWSAKENQYQTALSEKEGQIKAIRRDNALSVEMLKQNAYPEAIIAMRDSVVVKDDGTLAVKGKDANGIDRELPLEDGVKAFLKERPYLIKAGGSGGSGTGGQGSSGQGGSGTDQNLSQELIKAMQSGDLKRKAEIKQQMRTNLQAKGF